MKNTIIAPSILSADFACLREEIQKVEEGGATWLHFDVMDGHFVPNISFGIPVLNSISGIHNMVNDVHIMIENPKKYAKKFILAGADYLTFHYEACKDIRECREVIDIIHENGAKAGISIKPNTDVHEIFPLLKHVDLVLIMTVEPGFGGQELIKECLGKIMVLKYEMSKQEVDLLIEVDGGINETTAAQCLFAGADILVAGSYLFGHDDIKERIKLLKNAY